MGLLNTDEAPGSLILPEDPDDLLDIDPAAHLERMIDAGVPLDDIDRRMDAFFGRASASIAPSRPRMLTPKARNNSPTNLTPRSEVPSLDEFLKVAGPRNPDKSAVELARFWNEEYGDIDPKTLPSLETFLPTARAKNPNLPDPSPRGILEGALRRPGCTGEELCSAVSWITGHRKELRTQDCGRCG